MDKLILVANPGRASRRFSVFSSGLRLVELHFEEIDHKIICTIRRGDDIKQAIIHISSLDQAAGQLFEILQFYDVDIDRSDITKVAVKVTASSEYFSVHRLLDSDALAKLQKLETPAGFKDILHLRNELPAAKLVGISDSAFHTTIPEFITNSSLILQSDHQGRCQGCYGISAGSVVNQLRAKKLLPERLVVCHLGNGTNVSALKRGKSINTVDIASPGKSIGDLREVLTKRRSGNQAATLAIETYISDIQQLIGLCVASLGGLDGLVLTGSIGETSAEIRSLLAPKLAYLGVEITSDSNHKTHSPDTPALIGASDKASLFVVSAKEDYEMARLAEIIR